MVDTSSLDTQQFHNKVVIEQFKRELPQMQEVVEAHNLITEAELNFKRLSKMIERLKSNLKIDENDFFLANTELTELRYKMVAMLGKH